jgi:membrane protease YdiL (CAAX protease family)
VIWLGSFVASNYLPTQPAIKAPPPWQGFLASISAGVNEEILLRLGFMTFVAWVLTRISRRKNVGAVAGWTSIILAALVFGAMHLPIASTLTKLSFPVVVWLLVANGLVGIACGWLYWRRSLLAAMIAHFATDIILHVIAPAISAIS